MRSHPASMMDGVDQRTRLVGRNRLELLLFRLGRRQRFGINVFKVREVIKCPPLTQMPHAHPAVRGISNIRGVTIPVMDLAAAVGLPPSEEPQERFVIVAEYNRTVLGFLVDTVDRIVNLNWEAIKPPPRGVGDQTYLTAVTEVDGEMVEVIDVERVLADVIGVKTEVDPSFAGLAGDAGATPRVLFVDDSALARKQIQRVLDQIGIEYLVAENGREAYERILALLAEEGGSVEQRLPMVISDVEMPEMDGYTLTRKIKEHPDLKGIYVCLHTSLSGNFNRAMVEKVGADDLLSKFDPDDLARLVCAFFAKRLAAASAAAA